MASTEERMRVLRLIEEGKISAEEGARLLSALAQSGRKGRRKQRVATRQSDDGRRWIRVRVADGETGQTRVDMSLPLSLVGMGLAVGARFVPDIGELDMGQLQAALRSGATGKILEVADEDGEVVEIFVE